MNFETNTGLLPFAGEKLPFPKFERPKLLGFFSLDTNRQFCNDQSQLRYLKLPTKEKFPLDLNSGIYQAKKKNEDAYDEKLENILKFIFNNTDLLIKHRKEHSNEAMLKFDFVCLRGLLRLIMCTPYENQDWCIRATNYRGTIYLHKVDTEQDKFQRAQQTEQQQRLAAYGFKFEQYCVSDSPSKEAITDEPVNECEEFVCVFCTKINTQLKILYGAEMDGILSNKNIKLEEFIGCDHLKFIELKTRQDKQTSNQQENFKRYKMRNWWCQSFLVGIEDIFVGLRKNNGYVERIEHIKVNNLKDYKYWAPTSCANFLVHFLSYINSTMVPINCPFTVFEYKFYSRNQIIAYTSYRGQTNKSFLPDWYINMAAWQRKF